MKQGVGRDRNKASVSNRLERAHKGNAWSAYGGVGVGHSWFFKRSACMGVQRGKRK